MPSPVQSRAITSTLAENGELIVQLEEEELGAPAPDQVLIKIDAAPINPSDLGLLFASADVVNAEYTPGRVRAQMPANALRNLKHRFGVAVRVGNEASGIVVEAGGDARHLIGKRVNTTAGGLFADYRLVTTDQCHVLPDQVTAEQGASIFVNPMTALAFAEICKDGNYGGIVHTAAASSLGRMLVRICAEDAIPLVNVVRRAEQVAVLENEGAEFVTVSSAADFDDQLENAIEATGANLLFDAIGGGTHVNAILRAMEQVARRTVGLERYGSSKGKQAYIYGALDVSAMNIVGRELGFAWGVNGWLLGMFLRDADEAKQQAMRDRIVAGLSSTFATQYDERISLPQMLEKDFVLAYNARRTGAKFIVRP